MGRRLVRSSSGLRVKTRGRSLGGAGNVERVLRSGKVERSKGCVSASGSLRGVKEPRSVSALPARAGDLPLSLDEPTPLTSVESEQCSGRTYAI